MTLCPRSGGLEDEARKVVVLARRAREVVSDQHQFARSFSEFAPVMPRNNSSKRGTPCSYSCVFTACYEGSR